jgi:hypothetical protein
MTGRERAMTGSERAMTGSERAMTGREAPSHQVKLYLARLGPGPRRLIAGHDVDWRQQPRPK